jgi:hypothetical protein
MEVKPNNLDLQEENNYDIFVSSISKPTVK